MPRPKSHSGTGRSYWAVALNDVGGLRALRWPAAWYFQHLADAQIAAIDIWRTTYYHRLTGRVNGLIAWLKGSALRAYLDRLSAADTEAFLSDYRAAVQDGCPLLGNGDLLLPYPHRFFVIKRADR